jgi:LAGLIDADG endonuclease
MLPANNNPANLEMLQQIQTFFGPNLGSISLHKTNNILCFYASSLKDCLIIKEHFIKFPLMSSKLVHFEL